ncbi:hypothetical protein DAI22_02g369200 [Oryza sativa Japonica Group]|nr:hypothetical protein DAI22_02g369200 [Oryza sativa Japonica Group]
MSPRFVREMQKGVMNKMMPGFFTVLTEPADQWNPWQRAELKTLCTFAGMCSKSEVLQKFSD